MYRLSSACAAVAAIAVAATASAQSIHRAAFVANDGNLEGSVTSFTINADGTLNFVAKFVTGSTPSTQFPVNGTNCYSIALSPSGRWLATGHTTALSTEWVTILEVNSDATLTLVNHYLVPDSPLDLIWLDDEHLAVTETNSSALPSRVRVWRFNPQSSSMIQTAIHDTGAFSTSLEVDPQRRFLFTQATAGSASGNQMSTWRIMPNGLLSHVQTVSTGSTYPMGLGISPNGKWLYAGGGISGGGKAMPSTDIDAASGALSLIAGSPFQSPSNYPKQVAVNGDSTVAVAGHGSSNIRSFFIDQATGALTYTGHGFLLPSAISGDLGAIAIHENLLLAPRRYSSIGGAYPTGVHAYTIGADGSLTENGSLTSTQGSRPNAVVIWPGLPEDPCPADLNSDGAVDVFDLLVLLGAWGANPGHPADLNGDGMVDVFDLLALLSAWGPCE